MKKIIISAGASIAIVLSICMAQTVKHADPPQVDGQSLSMPVEVADLIIGPVLSNGGVGGSGVFGSVEGAGGTPVSVRIGITNLDVGINSCEPE